MQALKWERRSDSTYRLEADQWVPAPLAAVFPFFAEAENLELLTPPSLRFRVLTPRPITMEEGLTIDYRLRLQGVPFRWRSRIAEWNPPHGFTDIQERGPYLMWEHRHRFEPAEGGTRIVDVVDYRVPLGRLVHGWAVKPQLNRIFTYRAAAITERFGSKERQPSYSPGL